MEKILKEKENISFEDFNLSKQVMKAIDSVGYETPTPIQALTIPIVLEGSDLVGQAQTGTGKTAAFALPLLSRIDVKKTVPQVLVLAPTRELAIQVAEAFQKYAAFIKNFHVLPIYGGQEYGGQLRRLKRGVHVVVGTPGRIMDHLRKGSLKLDSLSCVVLDEADEMLKMGFIDDVEWILEQTPKERQINLFSATIPPAIKKIAKKYLTKPQEVCIEVFTTAAETIRQRYWMVSGLHKVDALTRILEVENYDGVIIFVRTKTDTIELATKLKARGYACEPINGDIKQSQREKTIQQLKDGRLNFLVATDVAARGLDVERLSHVINYDIPYDTETYVHRIGRTGRAGRTGEAILFVSPRERRLLKAIEKATKQKIEMMELPSTKLINNTRIARFKQKISDTLAENELNFYSGLMEQYMQETDVPAIEIAAALAKLFHGNVPLLVPKLEKVKNVSFKDSDAKSKRASFPKKSGGKPEEGMDRFKIEVGHKHKIKPGNIVGTIANEIGLDSDHIGKINIYDNYSTIDLPDGIPSYIFEEIGKLKVLGHPLNISKFEDSDSDKYEKRKRKSQLKRGRSKRNKNR